MTLTVIVPDGAPATRPAGCGSAGPRGSRACIPLLLLSLAALCLGGGAKDALGQEAGAAALADSATALEARANSAYEKGTPGDVDRAAKLFRLAAESYAEAGQPAKAGEMLANAGYLHNVRGRADSAFAAYRRSLEILRKADDRATLALALGDVGELHHRLGQVDSAVVYFEQSLDLAREAEARTTVGRMLSNLGVSHRHMGRLDLAADYLERALEVRRELGDRLGEAVTLNNQAQVQIELGRPDSAIALQRESLAIRRELEDRAAVGTVLNNIGLSFSRMERPDSSLAYYRQALEIWRELDRPAVLSLTLSNIGRAQRATGRLDSALVYSRQSLDVARDLGDRASAVWALEDLGLTYMALGRPDSARAALREGLEAARGVGDRAREGEILFHLGRLHHRGMPSPELEVATAYYDSAAAARARVAGRAGGEENRVSFAEQDVRLFEEWTLAWLAREDVPDAEYAALAAAERGRAQALLDLMRSRSSQGEAEGGESRGEEAREGGAAAGAGAPIPETPEPGADLAAEGRGLAGGASRPGTATLYYLASRDTLVSWVVRPDGDLRVHRAPVAIDSLAAWVGYLRTGLGVDHMAAGEQLALRGGTELEERPAAPGPPRRGSDYAASLAGTLSDLLLPPAEALSDVGEVLVVPQGPLTLLPFTVLPLGKGNRLVEPFGSGFALRYAPSLAALSEARARPALEPSRSEEEVDGRLPDALVVGDPTMPAVRNAQGEMVELAPLPGSAKEARWLAEMLGTRALVGEEAMEAAVRQRLGHAPIVHLATHGYAYASEERARDSFMALAPGQDHDGLLTVGELLQDPGLSLEAELVVLSACQTGLGDLKQAEGTVGLQRAFLARGARSVLVSLWSVSDVVTEEMMRAFYTHWLRDEDRPTKAEALRRAQEDVKTMVGFEHPRFWGAFQLVGAE